MNLTRSAGLLALVAALAACERELILEGERLDLRAPFDASAGVIPENRAVPISLPAETNHTAWPQRMGTADSRITHAALGSAPALAWSAPIGQGEGRRHRITADPAVADGRIFTLDSRARVTATSTSGQTLWQRDLTPPWAGPNDASGGAVVTAGGRVFVSSAFGRLVALDAQTGQELWSQRFDAAVNGPALVAGDRLYVVASDSSAWAIDVENGRVQWQLPGTPSAASMVGGASPAVSGRTVLLPFPSGEMMAVLRDGGVRLWATTVAGQRQGQGYAGVTDITGDPVIVGDRAYVGNQSGRAVALDMRTGARIWTANEGAYGPLWVAGGAIFLISDNNNLVRLDAASGERVWAIPLPLYTRERERRRAEVFAHYGPVLAGGRLWVSSNDGTLRAFDPVSGALLSEQEVPRGATTRPIVVDRTLYLVSTDGRLHAFR